MCDITTYTYSYFDGTNNYILVLFMAGTRCVLKYDMLQSGIFYSFIVPIETQFVNPVQGVPQYKIIMDFTHSQPSVSYSFNNSIHPFQLKSVGKLTGFNQTGLPTQYAPLCYIDPIPLHKPKSKWWIYLLIAIGSLFLIVVIVLIIRYILSLVRKQVK